MALAVGALVCSLVAAGCSSQKAESKPDPTPTPNATVQTSSLTLGMFGHPEELVEHEASVAAFNAANPGTQVTLEKWADPQAGTAALTETDLPDVFLTNYADFDTLLETQRIQPVANLLDERGIAFGDRFSRPALESFAGNNTLQCMPYEISPQVVFYNTELINDVAMKDAGLSVPSRWDRWSFQQFADAAEFASKPRKKIRGFAVQPTLTGLTPFLLSGGGTLFNEDETSLAFSEETSREALNEVLPVLRDPKLSLSAEQVAKKSAVEWFKDGKLAMMVGTRDLVPELRASGVPFDVRAMPTVQTPATIGTLTALCISADTKDRDGAADLITDLVSDEQLGKVTRLGYMVPANLAVAGSDAVVDITQYPFHGRIFPNALKAIQVPPRVEDWAALSTAVDPLVAKLLLEEPTLDLDSTTEQIDTASLTVLAPTAAESPSVQPSGPAN